MLKKISYQFLQTEIIAAHQFIQKECFYKAKNHSQEQLTHKVVGKLFTEN
jgi:hypothetical protein